MPAESPFLQTARDRVLILDGAMGTSLHRYKPTDKDWGYAPNGKSLMNLSDVLVYNRPEWIREIHRGFFAAGCDRGFRAALKAGSRRPARVTRAGGLSAGRSSGGGSRDWSRAATSRAITAGSGSGWNTR